jgi:hypothetical protein
MVPDWLVAYWLIVVVALVGWVVALVRHLRQRHDKSPEDVTHVRDGH